MGRTTSLCLALAIPLGGAPYDDGRGEVLARELPVLLEEAELPGLSIAVAGEEGVVWSAGFGVRVATTDARVDSETAFEAASLSKPVFAYIVLQLIDEGVIELDMPLVDYAPLEDVAHDPRHRSLTARMALSHTVGLPNWRPRGGALDFQSDPGGAWNYSGEGFVLLQKVVEELTQESIQDLASRFVFGPLEMKRSSFVWRDDLAENMAHPHDGEGNSRAPRRVTRGNAAFSLVTTAPDYSRFLAAMMRGDRISQELRAAMVAPQVDVSPGVFWGLGWGLEANPDGLSFWHWGHNDGYRAYTVSYPARNLALVYFANGDNGMLLLQDLVELATGEIDHPALRHLDYESYDTPKYVVLRALEEALRSNGVDAAVDRYFELVEEVLPETFPEDVLAKLGYELLALDRAGDAVELFRVNAEIHPDSAAAHSALGDGLLAEGRAKEAVESYARSLELNPNDETTRKKIRALGSGG